MLNAGRSIVLGSALLATLVSPVTPSSQASAPPAVAQQKRVGARDFHAKVYFYGRDDESWPEKDENVSRDFPDWNAILGDNRREATYYIDPIKWGGECRFEVDPMKAQVLDDGTIRVSGTARLYEGTEDTTTNLRDYKNFSFDVPKRAVRQHNEVHLTWSGGDFGTLKFDFDNVRAED